MNCCDSNLLSLKTQINKRAVHNRFDKQSVNFHLSLIFRFIFRVIFIYCFGVPLCMFFIFFFCLSTTLGFFICYVVSVFLIHKSLSVICGGTLFRRNAFLIHILIVGNWRLMGQNV